MININRDLDVGVDMDGNDLEVLEVGGEENGEMIDNIDSRIENNFEGNNFGVDEWMRQLHQQQEGIMGQNEASFSSPQQQQFRHQYEQLMPLSIPTGINENSINNRQNEIDESKEETDQLRIQELQENHPQHSLMPRVQSMDGFQNADNIATLNNILQRQQQRQQEQQQRQQQHEKISAVPKNSTQARESSFLEQQLAIMQQQQDQNDPSTQQRTDSPDLQESLLQLKKLQEQQQLILKNISQTGLIDTSSLMNPLGTLLNTLIGQINTNSVNNGNNVNNVNANSSLNNNDNGTNNNDIGDGNITNNVTNFDQNKNLSLAWGQMSGSQHMQLTNNTVQSSTGMLPSVPLLMQEKEQDNYQLDVIGMNDMTLDYQQPQRPQRNTFVKRRQPKSNHSFGKTPNFGVNGNSNINIQFPSPPIIRKIENKKKKPKSFPSQLWDAMMTEGPSNDAAFEWLPDGKSFVVVDSAFFCKEILDRKFKQSKYGSFVRKLHRWGFIRLTSGTGTDCFHHPLFQRSRPELVSQIKCNSRNGKDGKKGHNAYSRGEMQDSVQPSLMGVEKFIRAKVVATDTDDVRI